MNEYLDTSAPLLKGPNVTVNRTVACHLVKGSVDPKE